MKKRYIDSGRVASSCEAQLVYDEEAIHRLTYLEAKLVYDEEATS
jgi:hypothetical protein